MIVSKNDWENYISKMSDMSITAGNKMQAYIDRYGIDDREELIRYANALILKYGEGTSALACTMFDEMATISNKNIPYAEPSDIPSYGEVAKNINGSIKQSPEGKLINSTVQRMVKQRGADTTLKNAIKYGAQFAWIPHGDTCPFCLMLASNGWQNATKRNINGGHAEHIHSHCDCQYALRFDDKTSVAGYNPDKYKDMFDNAEGRTWEDKINYMRRLKNKSES